MSVMTVMIVYLLVALCGGVSSTKRGVVTLHGSLDTLHIQSGPCPEYPQVVDNYRDAMYNFTIETFKLVARRGNYQFVMSPHAIWITLAAIAEGADWATQKRLFQLLLLPNNSCVREQYYRLATSRFSFTPDANVISKRSLVIDTSVLPNPVWYNFVTQNVLLEVLLAPIRRNPAAAANIIQQVAYSRFPQLDLRGYSVLINTVDYNGLWNTAFGDAVVRRAPFYNILGEHIGGVDLMTVKRHGKMGYIHSLQAKILELPIGTNSQYIMIIALVIGNKDLRPVVQQLKSSILPEVIASLRESKEPINVTIPQFTINTVLDVKTILEDLDVTSLWRDPGATRYISYPPAIPSSYIQRATLTLNKHGVNPPSLSEFRSRTSKTPEETFWTEFIADRPFMFGVFDAETYNCLISAMYTQPTYPK